MRAGLGVKAELEHPGSQGAGRGGCAFAQKGGAPGRQGRQDLGKLGGGTCLEGLEACLEDAFSMCT